MAALKTVYAIHDFDPENEDEIDFKVGEPIIVLELDNGFNDGWWKGCNARGNIGLFPSNYTTSTPPAAPSLEQEIDSLQADLALMHTNLVQPSPSLASTTSNAVHVSPITLPTPAPSTSTSSGTGHEPLAVKTHQQQVVTSLSLPELRDTLPEDWDVDQVATWLSAMGFEEAGNTFKSQEITGDILLELSLDSLKELNVDTFGKRFKIHSAIQALRRKQRRQSRQLLPETTAFFDSNSRLPSHMDEHPVPNFVDNQFSTSNSISASSPISQHSLPVKAPFLPNDHTNIINGSPVMPMDQHTRSIPGSVTQAGYYQGLPALRSVSSRTTMTTESSEKHRPSGVTNSSMSGFFRGSLLRSNSKQGSVFSLASRTSIDSVAQRKLFEASKGEADMEGWLHKQGGKYKTWNKRWFVLRGVNLMYFKNPKDSRIRGIINLLGYKIVYDETIYSGKYCFKVQHDRERTFCFYTDTEPSLRQWVNALMKATISRDYTAPVLSSSSVPTVSLRTAQQMKPRPPSTLILGKESGTSLYSMNTRPFSPVFDQQYENSLFSPQLSRSTSVMETSRSGMHNYAHSDYSSPRHSYSSKHQHLPFSSPHREVNSHPVSQRSPLSGTPSVRHSLSTPPPNRANALVNTHIHSQLSTVYDLPEEDEDLIDPHRVNVIAANRSENQHEHELTLPMDHLDDQRLFTNPNPWRAQDYLKWVNQVVPEPISNLSQLKTGDVLLEFLERLSGKVIRRPKQTDPTSPEKQSIDCIVAAFKFMGREGVTVDGRFNMRDIFTGDVPKTIEMLHAIKVWATNNGLMEPSEPVVENRKEQN